MNIKEFSNLIEKYKKGECSPREKYLLEEFLESFQSNHDEWIEDEMGNQQKVNQKVYFEIMKNIAKEKNHYFTKTFYSTSFLKLAASIISFIILASGILYVSGIFQQDINHVVWQEKIISSGEISSLTLPDGSKVILNADSKLRYPNQFDGANRTVYLEGEAYFEVRHNINLPFIVHAGCLSTTVLGTKFNIYAYPENKTISVALLEGKVKVSVNKNGKSDRIVVLKPEEQLLYNKQNNESSFGIFDSLATIGWKDKIYKFDDEPLSEVLAQLDRAYGVKFKLTDQSVLSQKITVRFENDSLQTVVYVIKSLTGLNYKVLRENNKKEISFFRNTN